MIDINQAFRPLYLTYFFNGLCVYPRKKVSNKLVWWITYVSIMYSLTIWFVYGSVLYYVMSTVLRETFGSTIILVIMAINIITTITTMIISVYYNKRFSMCMQKLAAIDDTLEKLGSPKIYRKVHLWSKRIVIGWIIHSFALNSYNTLWWMNKKETASWAFVIANIINHCPNVNAFVDLVYITFFWYIGNRFDKINEHMRYLIVDKEHELRRKWEQPAVTVYISYCNNYKRILWSSMHLHLELCRVTRELNTMSGTQMTFEMVTYLLFLTGLCYYLYIFIQMEEHRQEVPLNTWFHIIFWGFGFVARLWTINYTCENISTKASELDEIIHQLTNTLRYADMWEEIYQFTLQTMHYPLRLTGMGFFYFGNQFLRKFCMTLVTFVIIIVQMPGF